VDRIPAPGEESMKAIGKTYKVQGLNGFETVISVLDESDKKVDILMTSVTAWGRNESNEELSKELFESCIRTGYLQEISEELLTIR
jgi:hypothetical protein